MEAQQNNPIAEVLMAIFVIGVIIILLVEMPNWVINFSISLNITIGIVLLMISLYVQRPLELAAFPSIILMGTMFRLVLSIASTRLILAKGEAGAVIEAFGNFVTGGNLVVGFVIFLIITIVQFLVITKGAERIAEVSARFALDAMPGKQMTIDADFNAGLISPDEAVQRREDLQRESSLFGSMDGAMKFVKGDTIAGIIIVIINIVGGLCVGVLMNQMPLADAVGKYTVLTVGDGLASQIPSLLMSIAAGVVMTRSTAASSSLGQDLSLQIFAKPGALGFACVFLGLIAITSYWTHLPWWPFVLFIGVIAAAGFSVAVNQDIQQQVGQLDKVKQNMQDLVNPNKMYERLGVDVLNLQVGSGLLVIADPEQNGQLLPKIAALRQRVTDELGYIIPNIRIMDASAIADNEYLIAVRGNTVSTGMVYPGKLMVIVDQWDATGAKLPENAIVSVDPTYQTQAYWINPEDIAENASNVTAVDSVDVIVTHLQDCVRKYVDEVMTKTDVLKLMELVKSQDPTLVNDLVPTIISTSDLRKIFVNLIREKVSIRDIIFIFERLCDYARFSKEPDILSERLRAALGRQICLANSQNGVLYALTLSNEWEKMLDDSCQRTELGTMFLLNPMQVQELIEATANTIIRAQRSIGKQPVILCSPRIRLPLYQMLERHIPTIVIISYSELITDIRVEAIDTIGE